MGRGTPYLPGMSRSREPVFNFGEPAPVRFAALLIALFALLRYTPLGNVPESGELLVLRPLAVTEGAGWFAAFGHSLAHAGWAHVLMNSAFLVIFSIVTMRGARAKAIRGGTAARPERAFALVFLAGVLAGALAQWAWWAAVGDVASSAVGASGGVSALLASTGYAVGGRKQMNGYGLAWVLINAVFLLFPVMGGGIAWAAHLGGFAGGMLVAPFLVSPGSTQFRFD